jgi:hypothetical protein
MGGDWNAEAALQDLDKPALDTSRSLLLLQQKIDLSYKLTDSIIHLKTNNIVMPVDMQMEVM